MELIVPHSTIRRVPGSRQLCYVESVGECDLPGSGWLLDFLLGEVCAFVLSADSRPLPGAWQARSMTEERHGVGFVVGVDSLEQMLEPDVASAFGYTTEEAVVLLERAIRTCVHAGYIRTSESP
jgi:hypothetical protein